MAVARFRENQMQAGRSLHYCITAARGSNLSLAPAQKRKLKRDKNVTLADSPDGYVAHDKAGV
jgi:hypothetical protein